MLLVIHVASTLGGNARRISSKVISGLAISKSRTRRETIASSLDSNSGRFVGTSPFRKAINKN